NCLARPSLQPAERRGKGVQTGAHLRAPDTELPCGREVTSLSINAGRCLGLGQRPGRCDSRSTQDRWLRLTVNEAKSAVARPEERKFLGFSISNDGSRRRIAKAALDKFRRPIREIRH